jgi:hypothetical protein
MKFRIRWRPPHWRDALRRVRFGIFGHRIPPGGHDGAWPSIGRPRGTVALHGMPDSLAASPIGGTRSVASVFRGPSWLGLRPRGTVALHEIPDSLAAPPLEGRAPSRPVWGRGLESRPRGTVALHGMPDSLAAPPLEGRAPSRPVWGRGLESRPRGTVALHGMSDSLAARPLEGRAPSRPSLGGVVGIAATRDRGPP